MILNECNLCSYSVLTHVISASELMLISGDHDISKRSLTDTENKPWSWSSYIKTLLMNFCIAAEEAEFFLTFLAFWAIQLTLSRFSLPISPSLSVMYGNLWQVIVSFMVNWNWDYIIVSVTWAFQFIIYYCSDSQTIRLTHSMPTCTVAGSDPRLY